MSFVACWKGVTCLTIADLGREYLACSAALYDRADKISQAHGARCGVSRGGMLVRSLLRDADRCRLEGLSLLHYYYRDGAFANAHPRL